MSDVFTFDAILRVVVGFVLGFGVLPWFVLPKPAGARTALDRAGTNFVRWMGLVIGVGHLLALARLYHLGVIFLLCGLGIWLTRLRGRRRRDPGTEGLSPLQVLWIRLTDLGFEFEQRGPRVVAAEAAQRTRQRLLAPFRWLRKPGRLPLLALSLPMLAVFAWAFWIRFELATEFTTLSPPSSYVVLTWTKSLLANDLYTDGLYPPGILFFFAFLGKAASGIDTYEVVRFGGPLIGALMVVGLYYAVLRLTRNAGAAIATAVVFGVFGNLYQFHEPWIRQTGPLPHELGLVVVLFALPAVVDAVIDGDRDHLWTVAAGAIAAGLIHPVSLMLFVLVALVAATFAALAARGAPSHLFRTIGVALGAGVASQLNLVVGTLFGIAPHRGLDNPYAWVRGGGTVDERLVAALGTSDLGHGALALVAGAGALSAIVVGVVLALRGRKRVGGQLAALGAVAALAVAFYDVRWLDLPINYLGPIANLMGVMTALGIGAAVGMVLLLAQLHPRVAAWDIVTRTSVFLLVGVIATSSFAVSLPRAERTREASEYETTAAVTRQIMRENESFGYTVIGTPQQSQLVAGIGSFIELWVFARDVTLRDARDPGFVVPDVSSLLFARDLGETLPIPTQNIYIFVEKAPYPVTEQDPTGPAEEYYYNRERRGRIMATVYGWAEFYRHYHTDMDVFFETENIVVYRIRRRPNALVATVSPQFKDYTWEPGVLFNAGPAHPSEVVIPWLE
ncbi:MAG: hypothetical protein ACRDUY_09320 [Nitriliruptorales bacterium]